MICSTHSNLTNTNFKTCCCLQYRLILLTMLKIQHNILRAKQKHAYNEVVIRIITKDCYHSVRQCSKYTNMLLVKTLGVILLTSCVRQCLPMDVDKYLKFQATIMQGCDLSSHVLVRTKRTNPIWICIWFGDTKFATFP